tara:strand:- start:2172 stop:2432 length:261 start_codon:yes stop_codon:yes gene_type:complete
MPWLVTQKGVMAVSAIDCYSSAMPQVSHCAVMQVPFVSMAIRPNPLLSKRAIGIKKIWMSLKLDVTGLAQSLLMGVMISPGKKLSS